MLKIIKHITLVLFITLFFFTTLTCKKSSPVNPAGNNKIIFTFEDASCTEAWFNLKINDLQFPVIVDLYKDNFLNKSLNVFGSTDTTFYIEDLLPKKKYEVYVKIKSNNGEELTSERINFETMDTTSHDFSWQSWEFGQHSSSTLYDVAIIDENNIWAVGEIYMLDSLGRPDPNAYNAVHWDGTKWELKRINVNFRGNIITPPLEGVFAFSGNDIWFVGSLPIHGDGNNWIIYDLRTTLDPNISVSRCWGSSSNDMYFVGRNGNIAHWDGVRWTRIESGTDLRINDIWGDYNEKTGKTEILAIAAELDVNRGSKVLRIEGNSVTEEYNNGLSWDVGGIWFKSGRRYYIAGAGIHQKHYLSDSVWKRYSPGVVTNYVGYGIKGSDINNVFAVGSFLEIVHYNGFSWHNYLNEIFSTVGALSRIAIVENLIVAVGLNGSKAIIFSGKRN
ncbi:MAG: glucosyl transferase [Ignavibacteria bacterium]|nr:glucosyl transferase [Ignavibacteria bacterium]